METNDSARSKRTAMSAFKACGEDDNIREDARDADENGPTCPRPADVFMGRGKGTYERRGNKAYMEIISSYLPAYMTARNNADKIRITEDVIALVKKGGGRFLGVDKDKQVYEVSDAEARIKVSQALRHKRLVMERNRERARQNQDGATETDEDERLPIAPSAETTAPSKLETQETALQAVAEPPTDSMNGLGQAPVTKEGPSVIEHTESVLAMDIMDPLQYPWLFPKDTNGNVDATEDNCAWNDGDEESVLSLTGLTEEDLESLLSL